MAILDPSFAGAFVDNTRSGEWSDFRVLGKRLRKFSLWHRFLLQAAESPFVTDKPTTLWDLRVAAGICRLKWPNSIVLKPKIRPMLIWSRIFLTALFTRHARNEPTVIQRVILPHVNRFIEYTSTYLQEPAFIVRPPDGLRTKDSPLGRAPDTLEHVSDLRGYGFPSSEAWNMPVGQANFWRAMAWRAAGTQVDFITTEEKEFMEQLPREFMHIPEDAEENKENPEDIYDPDQVPLRGS